MFRAIHFTAEFVTSLEDFDQRLEEEKDPNARLQLIIDYAAVLKKHLTPFEALFVYSVYCVSVLPKASILMVTIFAQQFSDGEILQIEADTNIETTIANNIELIKEIDMDTMRASLTIAMTIVNRRKRILALKESIAENRNADDGNAFLKRGGDWDFLSSDQTG